jgi:hypothetical protein
MSQRDFQLRIGEVEAVRFENVRLNPRTADEHVVRHFAKGQSSGEAGHWENSRAIQNPAKRFCELPIRDWLRCGRVHRTHQSRSAKRELNRADQIVERDPTHILPATADDAAKTKAERCEHFRESASLARQDESNPQINDADAGVASGLSRRLPVFADIGKKARPGR